MVIYQLMILKILSIIQYMDLKTEILKNIKYIILIKVDMM